MPGLGKNIKKIHSSRIEFIPHCTDLELHNKKQKKLLKQKILLLDILALYMNSKLIILNYL